MALSIDSLVLPNPSGNVALDWRTAFPHMGCLVVRQGAEYRILDDYGDMCDARFQNKDQAVTHIEELFIKSYVALHLEDCKARGIISADQHDEMVDALYQQSES